MKQSIYFFSVLYILISTTLLSAQSVTISEDVNIRNDNGYEIVGRHKGNVLLFRDKGTDFEVVAFDEQMRMAWEHKIEFPEKRAQVLDALQGKDYFAVIYKAKEKNNIVVKVHRFDANTKFIDSLSIKNYGAHFVPPSPISTFSENKKMALVYSFEADGKIEATAFDVENMKLIWQQEAVAPANLRSEEDVRQVLINDTGTAHFIFEKNESAALFGATTHEYHVLELNQSGNNTFSIPFKEFSTYGIRFDYDNQNRQLCAIGLYSDLNKSKATGCFFMKIQGQKPKIMFDIFDDELASAVAGKKINNNRGIADLRPQEIILRKDGGAIAMLEEVREFSRASTTLTNSRGFSSDATGRFVVDYYHESVIAVAFNPDGTVQWRKVLPKKQYSQDDQGVFSSYGVMKTPNQIRLLFNDEIRNETTTSEYLVRGSGSIDRHSMFNTTNQDILLRFKDGLQVSSDEMIVPSEYRSRLRLVRLKY
jgi:hypothetical protein